jgi:hypothetical protein
VSYVKLRGEIDVIVATLHVVNLTLPLNAAEELRLHAVSDNSEPPHEAKPPEDKP